MVRRVTVELGVIDERSTKVKPSNSGAGGTERSASVVFIFLCVLIALAPLPLGSARPLAWDLFGIGIALLLLGSVFFLKKEIFGPQDEIVVPVILFAIVIGVATVQVSGLTPAAWHNSVWDLAAEGLGHEVRGTIAVDPQKALNYILRLLSYAGVFYLSFLLCRNRARAHAAVKFVTLLGSTYAAYGLIVYWSGNTHILWLQKWAYGGDLTSTFVNRNSFATYLGLCVLATLCQFIISFKSLRLIGTRREKLQAFTEYLSPRSWLLLTLFLLITALFLTHSRGGLFATACGITILGIALSQAPSLQQLKIRRLVGLPLVFIAVAAVISGGTTADRVMEFMVPHGPGGRGTVYGLVWAAIRDHPILGTGLGSFSAVFPIYRTPDIRDYYDLAHNDYLQNALELGLPAAMCLNGAILWLIGLCVFGIWIRRRDAFFPALGIAASSLVAVHSLIDFSLQIPAVTITYVFLLGIGVAQSRSSA